MKQWAIPDIKDPKTDEDESDEETRRRTNIIYYPHFSTNEMHSQPIDR
jgi:hypothetical protein